MSELPPHVYAVPDRHGKTRYRFRRRGWPAPYINEKPGTAEFHRAYAEIIEKGPCERRAVSPAPVKPKSLDDLYRRMKLSPKWRRKKPRTQHTQALVYERFLNRIDPKGRRYGDRPCDKVSVGWLDTIFGAMHETPGAANDLRKKLSVLLKYGEALKWATNQVPHTAKYDDGEGYHDWTDAEIEQYRAHHELGTMARLVLEIALNTAGRRCNIASMPREALGRAEITTDHAKGNNSATVPMLATTRAALDAMPVTPLRFVIVTQFGKPYTPAGLGNRMRKWCDDAGLPQCSLHGLRKALSRQLAETGATDAQGMAVTGHKKDKTFQHYRAKANRTAMARAAVSNLGPLASFQPSESGGDTDV